MQETRVLVEARGTTGEETTSYWFDLPIDVAGSALHLLLHESNTLSPQLFDN